MKKTITLFLLFVCICISCPVIYSLYTRTVLLHISDSGSVAVSIHNGSVNEEIQPFYSESDDTYYFFLPSSLSGKKMYGSLITGRISIDNEPVSFISGFSWNPGKTYDLQYSGNNVKAKFLCSSKIPVMFISTETGNMDRLSADKEYFEKGSMTILDQAGTVEYKGKLSIKGRGNFTYDYFYKKPFHITLNDAAGILGMDESKDWCLLANSCDYSYMNNKLAFELAKHAGLKYTTDAEYADVYFNGEYWGLYLVTEKIKVGAGNITITDLEKENTKASPQDPDDITGGYLLERDYRTPEEKQPPSYFITKDFNTPVRIRSPKYATESETGYISSLVNEMEQAITAKDGYSGTGKYYLDYIDLESWAKYYVLMELANDEDLGLTSTFFYKDRDDIDPKVYMGPCWDFDQAFGGDRNHPSPSVLLIRPGTWFQNLYDKSEFNDELCKAWNEDYSEFIKKEAPALIEKWRELIRDSVVQDNIRWPRTTGYDGLIIWPKDINRYSFDYSYDESVDFFKKWLDLRCTYLDSCWIKNQ